MQRRLVTPACVVALAAVILVAANPHRATDQFRGSSPPFTLDDDVSGVIPESPQKLGCISDPVDVSGATEVQIRLRIVRFDWEHPPRRAAVTAYISSSQGRRRLLGAPESTSQPDYFRVYNSTSPAPHGTHLEIMMGFDPGPWAPVYLDTAIKRDAVWTIQHTDLQKRRQTERNES